LRAAGIHNINVDLIAGLPYQTAESWEFSLDETISSQAPHVSVYMLEVDEDSRLGRELMAGGTKYHAHFVPDDDLTADLYAMACERLDGAGVPQYEISNFARAGRESRHNLKYWTRQPYLGFGVDAHSMLPAPETGHSSAIRFATPDNLESYVAGKASEPNFVSQQNALEESFFLGLRLNRGVDLSQIAGLFGRESVQQFDSAIRELVQEGLLSREGETICLTARGRLLSNEVFARFLLTPPVSVHR
jgi:oxygen-independent coproporphyrinogen-3 oxidase